MKQGLRTTIRAVLIPTTAARLTRVAGVNLDHLDTLCLPFVLNKAKELGKAPRVEAPFGCNRLVFLATSNVGSSTNVFQVLKDNRTAGSGVLNNAFGEDVIVIFSLPKQLTRKGFQLPL